MNGTGPQEVLKFAITRVSKQKLGTLFQQIGRKCKETGSARALVLLQGPSSLDNLELASSLASLRDAGCREGFRLAWVTRDRPTFELLVGTEYPPERTGITSRVFFEERNAYEW